MKIKFYICSRNSTKLYCSKLVVALTLWSCGPANTPSAVAEEACKCLQNEDYEGYVELMDLKET